GELLERRCGVRAGGWTMSGQRFDHVRIRRCDNSISICPSTTPSAGARSQRSAQTRVEREKIPAAACRFVSWDVQQPADDSQVVFGVVDGGTGIAGRWPADLRLRICRASPLQLAEIGHVACYCAKQVQCIEGGTAWPPLSKVHTRIRNP